MTAVQLIPPAVDQTAVDRVKQGTPKPLSMTHRHLLSCVNTFLENAGSGGEVTRILDVGCGDGLLVRYLVEALSLSYPERKVEVYGMDVNDHGVQAPGYWASTLSMLAAAFPSTDWRQRLQLVSVADPWPFPDAWFDIVISNQVLEHVGDHQHFFRQHQRVLSSCGTGFHLFPLHHCIIEPHLRLPLVHWVRNRKLRKEAIAMTTRLGLGKFDGPRHQLDAYAAAHSDYLSNQVNYKTQGEIAAFATKTGLTPSFAKTHQYFFQKFRAVSGRTFVEDYPPGDNLAGRSLAILLRYISSVTLEVRRSEGHGAGAASTTPFHRLNA